MEYLKKRARWKKRDNPKKYNIITDFSYVSEKECIEADKYNDKIYRISLIEIENAMRIIESNGLTANITVPRPPTPTNHTKYLLWQSRSVCKPVTLQSCATLYLHNKGYVLDKDYEPYQAIDMANECIRKDHDCDLFNRKFLRKHDNNFKDIYTDKDKNILRKRKIFKRSISELKHRTSPMSPSQPIPVPRVSPVLLSNPSYPKVSKSYPPVNSYSMYPSLPHNPGFYSPMKMPSAPPASDSSHSLPEYNYIDTVENNNQNNIFDDNTDIHSVSNLVIEPTVTEHVQRIEQCPSPVPSLPVSPNTEEYNNL